MDDLSSQVDLAATSDLAVAQDLVAQDLAAPDLAAAADLATAADLAIVAQEGGATDGLLPSPDLARCNAYGGTGTATVVSGSSRPLAVSPLLAHDGTSTMAVWTVAGSGGAGFPNFGSGAWARVQGGTVAESGSLPAAIADVQGGELLVFASRFHLFVGRSLYLFNAGGWTQVSGFTADAIAVSGTKLIGVAGSLSALNVTATIYDGSTAGTPAQISTRYFGTVAGDGAGGFAVFTVENTTPRTIRMITYDGALWGSETLVGTQTLSIGNFTYMSAARSGALWCLAYVTASVATGYTPTAWVQSGGTWTSFSFTGVSPAIQLAANNGGFALGGIGGWTAVYAGTWTQQTLGSGSSFPDKLLPFGTGYAYAWGYGIDRLNVSTYNGSSWAAQTVLTLNTVYGTPRLAVTTTSVAVMWLEAGATGYDMKVATFDFGVWNTPPAPLSSNAFGDGALIAAGANFVAAMPEPGVIKMSTRSGSSFAASAALPSPSLSGAVTTGSVSVARTANGHALAVWAQYDGDGDYVYAAEHDGASWKTPVQIERGTKPKVAAAGNTFAVAWQRANTRWAAAWNGTGLTTPRANLGAVGSGLYTVASDGVTFVAAYTEGSSSIYLWYATSTDGAAWSTPQKIETTAGWQLLGLAGGPAGVVEWSTAASNVVTARLFQSGVWSAATTLSGTTSSGAPCRAAVAATTAMVACLRSSVMDAKLFATGAWSAVPPGTNADYLTLASDGVDYRLDTQYIGNPVKSRLYATGAWSAPVDDPGIFLTDNSSSAAACGHFLANHGYGTGIGRAVAGTAYDTSLRLLLTNVYNQSFFSNTWPGVTDAAWCTPPAGGTIPAAYVALGL